MFAPRCGAHEDGALEAIKFPREGAGLLSSLVETDGLIELGEDITRVEPGAERRFPVLRRAALRPSR